MRAMVVGLGKRGRHWLNHLARRSDTDVVACVEPGEAGRERARAEGLLPAGLPLYDRPAEALRDCAADFVLDVTPPAVHAEVAEAVFAAGLHLLGEKPLSDGFDTARRLASLGEAAGRVHMITQNYRFGAVPRAIRRLIGEGLIGEPGQCDVRFAMPWADAPGSHYVTEPYMLLNDMMVHHFDLMRYVLEAEPAQVQAITWNHPWGWHAGDAAHAVIFHFPSGLVATHVCCGCAVGSQTGWNGVWRIEGPLGSLDWEPARLSYHRLHRTEERISRDVDPGEPTIVEDAILDEFYAAIRERRAPECSASDHLKSLAMVFAAIRSVRERRPVELVEFLPA